VLRPIQGGYIAGGRVPSANVSHTQATSAHVRIGTPPCVAAPSHSRIGVPSAHAQASPADKSGPDLLEGARAQAGATTTAVTKVARALYAATDEGRPDLLGGA
jgi:hypothetical protein